jgi:uncharacterized membrane protein
MSDPMWMRAFLGVHIAAGFCSFLLAPVALATAKGGKQHRRWGMVYLWSMGVVAATALPMSLYRPVLFLALVAVFSFYAAWSGYRVLKLKDLARGGDAKAIDWVGGGVTFFSSAALAFLGVFYPHAVQNMGIVSVVFGVIGMGLAYGQLKTFVVKPKDRMFWWFTHMGNFIGSYVAAWSAFSVVTLTQYFGNAWYVWLWPTIVGVLASALAAGYYRKKFARRSAAAAV